jgi:hypothetical protein
MSNLETPAARQAFAQVLATCLAETSEIKIRADQELGDAGVLHCHWPLTEKGPYSSKHSREITVQISAGAMREFRAANPERRGEILARFKSMVQVRLLEGGYNPIDPPAPAFKIIVDDHAWEG